MNPSNEVVITADAHVGETNDLRRRLPEKFRDTLPEFGVDESGRMDFKFKGKSYPKRYDREPTEEDLLREFRTDPSQGTDLDRRLRDMAMEGVDGQVIFPNIGLGMSMGTENQRLLRGLGPRLQRLCVGGFRPAVEADETSRDVVAG